MENGNRTLENRLNNYTARYVTLESGYMGQLVEWPEVMTEGKTLEDCRASLRDALREMILAYRQLERELPRGTAVYETIVAEVA